MVRKQAIVLDPAKFKQMLEQKKLRGGCLYELDQKQIYYVDVPKNHPLHKSPYVLT